MYALLALCVGAFGLGLWSGTESGRRRFGRFAKYGVALQIAALVGAYAVVRPGEGDDGANDIAAAAAANKPIFVDLYSNY
jgi:hypothetical protein